MYTKYLLGVIVVLSLIILYYYQETVRLHNEVIKGCSKFTDPEMTATRDAILAKIRKDMRDILDAEISSQYDRLLNSNSKLQTYHKKKISKDVSEKAKNAVDLETAELF
jgi:hypothetical protein